MKRAHYLFIRWSMILLIVLLAAAPAAATTDRTTYDDATGTTSGQTGDPVDGNDYGTGEGDDDGGIVRGESGVTAVLEPEAETAPVFEFFRYVPIFLPGTWFVTPTFTYMAFQMHPWFGGDVHAR